MAIDTKLLRIELVKREMTMLALAKKLKQPPSTLSAWVRLVNPQPPDLAGRIESILRLKPGALSKQPASRVRSITATSGR